MAITQISYGAKVDLNPVSDATRQVAAADLNEIKSVVNGNATELTNTNSIVGNHTSSLTAILLQVANLNSSGILPAAKVYDSGRLAYQDALTTTLFNRTQNLNSAGILPSENVYDATLTQTAAYLFSDYETRIFQNEVDIVTLLNRPFEILTGNTLDCSDTGSLDFYRTFAGAGSKLTVSGMEDGKNYSITMTGTGLDTADPFNGTTIKWQGGDVTTYDAAKLNIIDFRLSSAFDAIPGYVVAVFSQITI